VKAGGFEESKLRVKKCCGAACGPKPNGFHSESGNQFEQKGGSAKSIPSALTVISPDSDFASGAGFFPLLSRHAIHKPLVHRRKVQPADGGLLVGAAV
jgi:hypothetical protein